jgi:formiminoglutamase
MGTLQNPEMGVDMTSGSHPMSMSVEYVAEEEGVSLEDGHAALRTRVAAVLASGSIPVVVGGGNDQSAPNGQALLDAVEKRGGRVGIVNVDAHLDVRPRLDDGRVHSGSPFRVLLEDDRFKGRDFVEFAAQGNQCAQAHADYVTDVHRGTIVWLSALRRAEDTVGHLFRRRLADMEAAGCTDLFVSFDIDAISGSDAPGVSCVASVGLSAREALDICYEAGRCPRVTLLDISELNPTAEEHRTARLVANMIYYFSLGVSQRRR